MAVNWHCWLLYENEFDRPPLRARFISKVPPEEHGAVCVSPLRDWPMCVHARKAQGRQENRARCQQQEKDPLSLLRWALATSYSTGCRDNLQLNFSRRHCVLSLASLVFSVVGSVCRRSQAYTLTSVLSSLAFGRPHINLAIGDAMPKIACLALHIRTCTYVAWHSLPSFRNNRNHVTARTN